MKLDLEYKCESFYSITIEYIEEICPIRILDAINRACKNVSPALSDSGFNYTIRTPMLFLSENSSLYGIKLWNFIFDVSSQYSKNYVKDMSSRILEYVEYIKEITLSSTSEINEEEVEADFEFGQIFLVNLITRKGFFRGLTREVKSSICDVFSELFLKWDLDHESPEVNDALELVLSNYLERGLKNEYLKLMCFRVMNGQHTFFDQGSGLIRLISLQANKSNPIYIKDILDCLFEMNESIDRYSIHKVCDPIYGSNLNLTNEIISYYEKTYYVTNKWTRLIDAADKYRKQADIALKNKSSRQLRNLSSIKTGFHEYIVAEGDWVY